MKYRNYYNFEKKSCNDKLGPILKLEVFNFVRLLVHPFIFKLRDWKCRWENKETFHPENSTIYHVVCKNIEIYDSCLRWTLFLLRKLGITFRKFKKPSHSRLTLLDFSPTHRRSINNKLISNHPENFKYLNRNTYFPETLRKYPPLPILMRKNTEDYTFENMKLTIPKNTRIFIPLYAIHRDPDIYPNPDVFDIDRFKKSAIAARHPMHYLPFGDGPRNCLGTLKEKKSSHWIVLSFVIQL